MNKYQQEYLGENLKVLASPNKDELCLEGRIIRESKNAFLVRTDKVITILKNGRVFLIGCEKISGYKITKRPHERIKIKG